MATRKSESARRNKRRLRGEENRAPIELISIGPRFKGGSLPSGKFETDFNTWEKAWDREYNRRVGDFKVDKSGRKLLIKQWNMDMLARGFGQLLRA